MKSQPSLSLAHPLVLGTMHDPASLRAGLRLRPGQLDALELRADGFPDAATALPRALARCRLPLVLTVRDRREGAIHALPLATRRALYQQFLQSAAAVDIELRCAPALADIRMLARATGVRLILSFHDFRSTPSFSRLREMARRAAKLGADVFKVAAVIRHPQHLAALHQLVLERPGEIAIAAMGMGDLGKISRLLLAQAGSVLNYGFLARAQVPGQWPALLFRQRLDELDSRKAAPRQKSAGNS